MILAFIAIILTLFLVIGLHELGHALAAKYFRVTIQKVSLGFGRPIMSWRSAKGCEWCWGWLPIGGYVQLKNSRINPVPPAEYPQCFDHKKIYQRIVILAAGGIANLLTALVTLSLAYSLGLSYMIPEVKSLEPNSPAAQAGIHAGARIISVEGSMTPSWNEVGMQLIRYAGLPKLVLKIRQDGTIENKILNLELYQTHSNLLKQIGITPNTHAAVELIRADSFLDSLRLTIPKIFNLLLFYYSALKQILVGNVSFANLIGPIGLFALSLKSLNQGIAMFAYFIANLSLAVGLINLLPLPGLDGGSIFYALLEKLRGKPVSVALEVLIHRLVTIGFWLILVQLLLNDLRKFALS